MVNAQIPTRLKEIPKWCVSKNKVPLDIYALKKGVEWGASTKRSHSAYGNYKEAKEISNKFGYPTTLFINSAEQAIYMIDIEKTCPKEVRQAIMSSLKNNIIYLERSLSDKGFHLMVNMPIGTELRTTKYKKWYEILTNHHCTFTMNAVDYDVAFDEDVDTNEFLTDDEKDVELVNGMVDNMDPIDFYNLIGNSNNIQTFDSDSIEVYKKAAGTFDGRHADLFGMLCDVIYEKTVDGDFSSDYSRYEFGYASKLHYAARRMAQNMIDANCNHYYLNMEKDQSIMLVYMVLKQMLPERTKHSEYRLGLPWLLYVSQAAYSKCFESSE